MIDNFDQIANQLIFVYPHDFYDLEIIRRGKDHPNLPAANRTIKSYYIDNRGYLESHRDEILTLCEVFGARAYIYPSVKNYEDVLKSSLIEFGRRNKLNDFNAPYRIFPSCVGKEKSRNPIWIVDVDEKDMDLVNELISFIKNECLPNKDIVDVVETKNGYHILTHPFNKKTFKDKYPDIEIKDNNPTILYIPKSI